MLYNTGKAPVTSTHGLLTTVAYQVKIYLTFEPLHLPPDQVEGEAASYALEGSVAVAGLALRFLKIHILCTYLVFISKL